MLKMAVIWDVAPGSQVDIDQRFRGAYCSIIRAMIEAVSTSETSGNIYQTTHTPVFRKRNVCEKVKFIYVTYKEIS
jgi:hypothetical protein